MNKEREFIIKITAKDAMDFSGKSLSIAKRWIKEHEFDMVERSVETNVSPVNIDENEKNWSVERSVEQQIYTKTPVEPTVYPEKPKFDFSHRWHRRHWVTTSLKQLLEEAKGIDGRH